jgi:N-acetylmuramoyl-L-alanine amidase
MAVPDRVQIQSWTEQKRTPARAMVQHARWVKASVLVAWTLLSGSAANAQLSEFPKVGGQPPAETTIRKGQGWDAAVTPQPPANRNSTPPTIPKASPPPPPDATQPTVTTAEISVDGGVTRLSMTLTAPAEFQVFALADPFRVIVDLPHVVVQLPASAGREARGLITAYRFGLFAADRSRIVIDTNGPVKVRQAVIQPPVQIGTVKVPNRLVIELEQTDRQSFLTALPAPSTEPSVANFADKVVWPKLPNAKPVIVIDPGHGGVDPGASAAGDVQEKDVVLAIAKQLEAALNASGRYDVRLTRSNDVFISLNQRVATSVAAQSSLFISLHADSIADPAFAKTARGASVYTLSDRASNRAAQLSADKENAVDALAGVENASTDGDDQVKSILVDLMKRETQMFSNDFRGLILDKIKPVTLLARDPGRSAAFKVLKQSHAPSVLVELGYLSNPNDAQQLTSDQWQRQAAKAIANAVDAYFSKPIAKTP